MGDVLADWERRLRDEGLAALDGGDLGEIKDWQARVGRERAQRALLKADGADTTVHRLRAEFWRRAETAAAMLPHGWPRGHFIRKAVQLGNVRRAARECRLTEKAGEWAWRKFLVFAGLPAPLVKGSQGRKRPTRDGLVRIEAGRYREERAA